MVTARLQEHIHDVLLQSVNVMVGDRSWVLHLILLAAGWKHAIKVEDEELLLIVDVPAHHVRNVITKER